MLADLPFASIELSHVEQLNRAAGLRGEATRL